MYKKILKRLAVFIFSIVLILNGNFVIDTIVKTNLNVSSGSFFELIVLFFIEISLFLIFYDFIMLKMVVWISIRIDIFCRFLIKKNNIILTQFMIRMDYNISKVFGFLRLGWVRYGNPNKSRVWIGISKSTLFQKMLIIVRVIISLPTILSIVLTLFALNIINIDWICSQWEYLLEFFKKSFTIKINIGDVFSKLPAVVALLTVLPVFFFFFFYSQKREVRKIIDKDNKVHFEIVVIKHNELSKLISKSIYAISENLDYVINCQSSIVDLILKKKIKNIYELEDRCYHSNNGIETYHFKEIPEMDKIVELILELTNEELRDFTRHFSRKKFAMWNLYTEFYYFKTSERLNQLFLTKQGMEKKIANITELPFDCSKDELVQYRNEQKDSLSWCIHDALVMLYALKRYNDSLDGYLNSSNVEKTLIKILLKEKH